MLCGSLHVLSEPEHNVFRVIALYFEKYTGNACQTESCTFKTDGGCFQM